MDWLGTFLGWAWARHHNVLSWYVRPLFILPYCWFAYRRSPAGLLLTLLLLPTSLFWFPAPERADPRVERYLAWERTLVTGDRRGPVAIALLAAGFLAGLGAAFWHRSWRWGMAVLNAGTLLKVVWSLAGGGRAGRAAVGPSLATLAVCNAAFLLAMRRVFQPRARNRQAAR